MQWYHGKKIKLKKIICICYYIYGYSFRPHFHWAWDAALVRAEAWKYWIQNPCIFAGEGASPLKPMETKFSVNAPTNAQFTLSRNDPLTGGTSSSIYLHWAKTTSLADGYYWFVLRYSNQSMAEITEELRVYFLFGLNLQRGLFTPSEYLCDIFSDLCQRLKQAISQVDVWPVLVKFWMLACVFSERFQFFSVL